MRHVDKKAFGARVAQRREALGLKQESLAAAVGMKQQGIDNIEHGIVARPRLLREIAAALHTSEKWLLWREGPEEVSDVDGRREIIQVPLLSWVSAGKLANADSQIPVEDVPLLAFADLGRGDFFALKVDGDSMDRVSPDGSTIVVNRADRTLIAGRCYIFSIRGETTYKRWQGGDPPYLEPHSTNPVHKPIFPKRKRDLEIVGRVRRTLLDL